VRGAKEKIEERRANRDGGYNRTIVSRTSDTIVYDLTHVTSFKTFFTRCVRFNINEEMKCFEEQFRTMGTMFNFWWQFEKKGDHETEVQLRIRTQGPWIMVYFTKRAEKIIYEKLGPFYFEEVSQTTLRFFVNDIFGVSKI